MRRIFVYPICLVLFFAAMWGIKTFLISLTPDFRNGFVLGLVLMAALVALMEKLGFKEPTY